MSTLLYVLLAGAALIGGAVLLARSVFNVTLGAVGNVVAGVAVAAMSPVAVAEEVKPVVRVEETIVMPKAATPAKAKANQPVKPVSGDDLELDAGNGVRITNIKVAGHTVATAVEEVQNPHRFDGLKGTQFGGGERPISAAAARASGSGFNPDQI